MKFARFLALTVAFSPALSMAQNPAGCSDSELSIAAHTAHGMLSAVDMRKTPTIEAFCASLRDNANPADLKCFSDCEARFQDQFAKIKSSKSGVQPPESTGTKPSGLKEAAAAHNAQPGGALASAPKIKPDGGMYYMHGKIKMAGEEPQFLAALSSSKENELLAGALRRSRGMGESTDYFAVTIPKSLQKYYFDNAKIDGGFDVVGRYVSNTKYKTVAGQEKAAPVFEAVYFVMW